ncbi:MAG: sensor histidine kinase, partial [Candidatus Sericytochromatia bacterium]
GVWLLGPKRAGTGYTRQDSRLLMTLAHQSAIALANAGAYERLRSFNAELEARVAERTQALELAQAKLVQTEKMSALGQLVAGVAHELNNPVTFLVSGVELLEERLADARAIMAAEAAGEAPEALAALRRELGAEAIEEEIASLLASCKEGADRARAIVQGLRDFSRLDGFGTEAVALGPCIETTVPMVAASFRDRVRIEVAIDEVPAVSGSAIHLKQVVLNLLVNACQAIADRGVVNLSLRAHAEGVALSVEDDGAGMSPEVRSRLFEPFYTTKPPGEGTGLGLAICHGIVTAHGGRIEVESEPGRGSVFTVVLPAGAAVEEETLADAADRR